MNEHLKTPRKKISNKTIKILGAFLLLLICARLALPYFAKRYINSVLKDHVTGYTGSIADLEISLWRGAYQLQGLVFSKVENTIPVPFIESEEIDFSIAWKPLFRGHFVGRVKLDRFKVNFVNGPSTSQKQAGVEGKGWKQAVNELFPLDIEELIVQRSELHFRDFSKKPEVDLYLRDLEGKATNLTNTEKSDQTLVSKISLIANVQKEGVFKLSGGFSLLKVPTVFDFNLDATKIDLVQFNGFLKSYGNFDVAAGDLNLYAEAASVDGKVKGYLKPLITHLKVLASQGKKDDPATSSDVIASLVNLIVRRYSSDKVAAKIPFEGAINHPEIGVWATIKSLFSNAFGTELKSGTDHSISLRDAKKVKVKKKKVKRD